MTLLLSRTDTDGLVPMADVIETVENAHADISRGTAYQPAPTTLALASSSGTFLRWPLWQTDKLGGGKVSGRYS